ncbi:unnamed protein product [Ixodes persulcatus]
MILSCLKSRAGDSYNDDYDLLSHFAAYKPPCRLIRYSVCLWAIPPFCILFTCHFCR